VILETGSQGITYVHLMFAQHEVICANGQWTESLLPGIQAIRTLRPSQVAEIEAIFPELFEEGFIAIPARDIVPVGQYRRAEGSV